MPLFDQPQKQRRKRGFLSVPSQHEFAEFAKAYWQAARRLADLKQVPSEDPPNYDAFPIGFLYRHALEVAVKSLLLEYGDEVGVTENDIFNHNHSLIRFVSYLEKLRYRYAPAFDEAGTINFRFDELEELLKEWDKNDPDALMFRYAVKKKNRTRTRSNPDFILDVPKFAGTMDLAMEYLFAVDGGISQLIHQEFLRQELGELDDEAS